MHSNKLMKSAGLRASFQGQLSDRDASGLSRSSRLKPRIEHQTSASRLQQLPRLKGEGSHFTNAEDRDTSDDSLYTESSSESKISEDSDAEYPRYTAMHASKSSAATQVSDVTPPPEAPEAARDVDDPFAALENMRRQQTPEFGSTDPASTDQSQWGAPPGVQGTPTPPAVIHTEDATERATPWPHLLPSLFPHRHPTLYVEYPHRYKMRRGSWKAAVPMSEELYRSCPLIYQTNKNANCVTQALKRAGFVKDASPAPGEEGAEALVQKAARKTAPWKRAVRSRSPSWNVFWGKHLEPPLLQAMDEHQICNHFVGSWCLGCKDQMWRHVSAAAARCAGAGFGQWCPQTYMLPTGRGPLELEFGRSTRAVQRLYIVKPPGSAEGRGIRLVNSLKQIPKEEKLLVQQYIANPLLIDGRKFDLRIYVLVTSFDPLRVYVLEDGLVRFATHPYALDPEDPDCLNDSYMHLTNYSINKHNALDFVVKDKDDMDDDSDDADDVMSSKWSLKALWLFLEKRLGPRAVSSIRASIHDIVVKTMISVEEEINSKYTTTFVPAQQHSSQTPLTNARSQAKCFELYGFDVMLDDSLKAWLIEVNVDPSLASSSPLDHRIKNTLASDTFHLLGLVPVDRAALRVAQEQQTHQRRMGGGAGATRAPGDKSRLAPPGSIARRMSQKESARAGTGLRPGSGMRGKDRLHGEGRREWAGVESNLSKIRVEDIELICEAEDELYRAGHWERVFPCADVQKHSQYMRFFASNRHSNAVLAMWNRSQDWTALTARTSRLAFIANLAKQAECAEDA